MHIDLREFRNVTRLLEASTIASTAIYLYFRLDLVQLQEKLDISFLAFFQIHKKEMLLFESL